MFGIVSLNYSFLLQEQVKYFQDDDPKQTMIILIAIGAIVVISGLIHVLRGGRSISSVGHGGKSKSTAVTPRKFNAFTLFRISSAYGLSREQTKLLEFVFRNDSVTDPERVMSNHTVLDRHFKKAHRYIEKNSSSDDEVQQRLSLLFSLRNAIEGSPAGTATGTSPSLVENTPAILLFGNDNYPVKILFNRGRSIITDIPRNALGTPLKISNGAKVTLSFFTKAEKGFSIEGQVAGTGNTVRGPGLKIAHSGKMKPLVKRQFRRKQITIKCDMFTVRIDESGSGKKKTNKLVIDNKKYPGTIQDISIGGCSIKTSSPIQVGSRIKLNLDYSSNYAISVLGQVLRINRSGYTGTIMHVKFLKVPIRAYNSINSLVFGFDEDKP